MNKLTIASIAAAGLLLGGCVTQKKYDALESEYTQLNQSMSKELGAKDVQISRMQDAIKVSINSELLFPSGGWEMTDGAKESIGKIVAILARQGITTNLILSQKRADTVMQFMVSKGANPQLISAKGFGDADPVASNDTAAGKAQNRRVELTVAPVNP
jgi:chemotaxis protein MotB